MGTPVLKRFKMDVYETWALQTNDRKTVDYLFAQEVIFRLLNGNATGSKKMTVQQ